MATTAAATAAKKCCDDDPELCELVVALNNVRKSAPKGAPGDPTAAINWGAIISSLPQLFALVSGWFSSPGKPPSP